ncbi:hypothetical protein BX600DRAFT_433524 [Xylariales sp. PMI_506]|nr:hypothetical protein BX600DRAFT_433524 [Xylariales sp. PMI_506]
MEQIIWRQALRAPVGLRGAIVSASRLQPTCNYSSVPSVAQTSFWRSLIPKPFRPRKEQPGVYFGPPKTLKKPKKDWNPATFYIVIFLFIGSMSIQMISLKKDFATYTRRAETRIGILKEVVEKLQRGEEVDVEKALGTGDAEKEGEWEEVLKEIERDDSIRIPKKSDRPKHSSSSRGETKAEPDNQSSATVVTEQSKPKTVKYSGFF